MKFLTITMISALLSVLPQLALAVDCPSRSYNLNSQAEVDTFPGSCDTIRGRLVIRQTDAGDPITNLNALSAIVSVGNNVQLRDTSVLTDISGLGSLASIGRFLLVRDNAALANLNGFSALSSLGTSLQLLNNAALVDTTGLLGLSGISGNLNIRNNGALANINGVAGITSIGGYVYILNNDALLNLDGLASLGSIGKYLRIQNNNILPNINGLSSLASVGTHVLIRNNDKLTSLTGLGTLTTIGSYLQVRDNNILTDITALGGITTVPGYLMIRNNDMLTNLDGLDAISAVGGNLEIRDNNVLANIDALAGIHRVPQDPNEPGNLTIRNNDALPNLDGLAQLVSVSSNVEVRLNDVLNACTALIPLLDTFDDDIVGPGVAPTPDVGGTTTIDTNGNTTCNSQADILTSVVAPVFGQSLTPDLISISAIITDSTIEFTIDNSGSIVRASELAFNNTLPAGLAIAADPMALVTCTGGTLTAAGGTTSITYTGGTVAANSSCSVKLDIIGNTEGSYTNTSGDLTFTLGNSGDSAATITVDDTPPVISIPGDNPLSLFVGDTFTDPAVTAVDAVDGSVNVTASGTVDTSVPGIYTRTYSAQDSVGNTDSSDLTVNVVIRPAPDITLMPGNIDFGDVVVGDTSSIEMATITNNGTAELSISAIDAAAGPFATAGGSCAAPPFTLPVGADCTLQYTFTPTTAGPATTQSLAITSNAASSPTLLALDGNGLLLQRSYTGPLPSGNTGTLSFTTADPTCSFEGTPQFLSGSGLSPAPPSTVDLIDGVAQFVISGCAVGATVDLTMDYGAALPSDAQYWKQGSPWREMAVSIAGSTAQFRITDGSENDDDGMADGRIVDPSGAASPVSTTPPLPTPPVAVPSMPYRVLVLLCLLMGYIGISRSQLSTRD